MDFAEFFSVSVSGIPLVLVVMGLVTWVSDALSLKDREKTIASMLIGLLLGIGYQASQGVPANFSAWFAVVVYGLALGLFASGIYDTGKVLASKVQGAQEHNTEPPVQ